MNVTNLSLASNELAPIHSFLSLSLPLFSWGVSDKDLPFSCSCELASIHFFLSLFLFLSPFFSWGVKDWREAQHSRSRWWLSSAGCARAVGMSSRPAPARLCPVSGCLFPGPYSIGEVPSSMARSASTFPPVNDEIALIQLMSPRYRPVQGALDSLRISYYLVIKFFIYIPIIKLN